jgi:hypothetical protein
MTKALMSAAYREGSESMAMFRVLIFLLVATGVFAAGMFAGASIVQPVLLGLMPWFHSHDQKL